MEGATTFIQAISTSISDCFTVMGTCFGEILEQPLLALFLAGSVIGVGIGAFAKLRSVV